MPANREADRVVGQGPRAGQIGPLAVLALAFAVLITGCGASGGGSSRASATRPTPLTLPDRLLRSTRFPGFHPMTLPVVVPSARAWDGVSRMPGSLSADEAGALQRFGFLGGVQERLAGRFGTTPEIYAAVEQFRSSTGASADFARRYRQARQRWTMPGASFVRFPTRGISESAGYDWAGGETGHAVLFTTGRFVYLVTTIIAPDTSGGPDQKRVIAAADAWYRRMTARGLD